MEVKVAEGKELRFSVSPGVLGLVAQSSQSDPGYVFTLSGDLAQMASQKEYLSRNGFDVGQCGVYPALKSEEEFKRSLALIWENKAWGWHNYERYYVQYGICSNEEFWAALRPHPSFCLGDRVDWNLDKFLGGLDSENQRIIRFSEICLSIVQEMGPGPFRVSQVRDAEYSRVYRPYYELLIVRKQVSGVWLAYDRRWHRWVDEKTLKIPGNEDMLSMPAHLFRKI
jgi:hypothetical protein